MLPSPRAESLAREDSGVTGAGLHLEAPLEHISAAHAPSSGGQLPSWLGRDRRTTCDQPRPPYRPHGGPMPQVLGRGKVRDTGTNVLERIGPQVAQHPIANRHPPARVVPHRAPPTVAAGWWGSRQPVLVTASTSALMWAPEKARVIEVGIGLWRSRLPGLLGRQRRGKENRCGGLPFMWISKRRKAWDMPQPRVMKEGSNMAHNDILELRPMKIGVRSVASPMSQMGPAWIVLQQPIRVVVGCPLLSRSLAPKAAF